MFKEIQTLPAKHLIGKSMPMSLAQNKTFELWNSFQTTRKDLQNTIGTDLYSVQVYDPDLDFKDFTPATEFTKWASIEVSNYNFIPEGFETLKLDGGLYAVFIHKGLPSNFPVTFQHIFGVWLPQSDYLLDNRPHFEVLGEKYKNNDPESEEEVWVPIKLKSNLNKV